MARPAVSVIVPAYLSSVQDGRHLGEQLEALGEQDYQGNVEVIVVDNRSSVDVRALLDECAPEPQPSVRYIAATAASGASYARNVGAEEATGEVLLFCDHDDQVNPDWVSRLVDFLGEQYDLASSAVEGETLNTANPRKVAALPPPDDFQPPNAFAPTLIGCSMACRAAVYRKLGGLDTGYHGNEDVEFGWRAHNAGFRVGYLPAALVAYRYRHGFRAGFRQGRARGLGLARLHADFPRNGLPASRFPALLLTLLVVSLNPRPIREERGLLLGITVGQLLGGLRHRTLRWW